MSSGPRFYQNCIGDETFLCINFRLESRKLQERHSREGCGDLTRFCFLRTPGLAPGGRQMLVLIVHIAGVERQGLRFLRLSAAMAGLL